MCQWNKSKCFVLRINYLSNTDSTLSLKAIVDLLYQSITLTITIDSRSSNVKSKLITFSIIRHPYSDNCSRCSYWTKMNERKYYANVFDDVCACYDGLLRLAPGSRDSCRKVKGETLTGPFFKFYLLVLHEHQVIVCKNVDRHCECVSKLANVYG